jgi:UDP-N-acetylmuramate dehydrogenase
MSLVADLFKNIKSDESIIFEENKDLTKYSTMKLSAFGDLITVKNLDGLKKTLKLLTTNNLTYRVLGWGANILLPSNSEVPYIQLDFSYDKKIFDNPNNEYLLPASVSLATLTSHANKFGLKGSFYGNTC